MKKNMNPPMTETILECISDGVFTVTNDWIISSFNHAAETITGIKKEDAVGEPCSEVFKSNMCENECPLRKTLKTGKAQINKSGFIINLHGDKIPISVSTAILKDSRGNIIGGAETFRDLSEIEQLRSELKSRTSIMELSSNNSIMEKIINQLPVIANNSSTVLIQGETGTGKELLAKTIHNLSPRKKNPFIAINCGAIPESLLESELFGYKKGAFTGADRDKPGRFSLAENGTLFLDEIGELPQALQIKLLRVLQEKEYEPLGCTKTEKTNVRIICATNRDLKAMTEIKQFRLDLYYRINVLFIEIPPLRQRLEDLPLLTERFLGKYNSLLGKEISGFTPDAYSYFYKYNWPGNIRELENTIERAVILCSKKNIDLDCLSVIPVKDNELAESDDIRIVCGDAEKKQILAALQRNDFSRTLTASELKIDKSTLYRKMKKYNLDNVHGKIKAK